MFDLGRLDVTAYRLALVFNMIEAVVTMALAFAPLLPALRRGPIAQVS